MAKILFGWELGGGLGHLMRIAPLANALRAKGHDVFLAAKNLATADRMFAGSGIKYLPAPILPDGVINGFRVASSYAHILHNIGFGDDGILSALTSAWRQLYRLTDADLIVLDHSPTAVLAARGFPVKVAVIGSGFAIPPDIYPFPELRPEVPYGLEKLREDEDRVLARVNRLLTSWGQSPLPRLGKLLAEVDQLFLTTFAELDHYPDRVGGEYWGPVNGFDAGGTEPVWPELTGTRVFAYLKECPALIPLIRSLSQLRLPTLVFGDGISNEIRQRFRSPTMKFATDRLDIRQAAERCDLAITHGTLGTTSMMLMAGKPLLLIPLLVEQGMLARIVERLGAGKVVAAHNAQNIDEALPAFLGSLDRYRAAAAALAARFSAFDPVLENQKIIERLDQLVPGQAPLSSQAITRPARVILLIRRSRPYWIEGRIDPRDIVPPREAECASMAIDWWNQTFAMSYAEFRSRVRDIAQPAHVQARFDQIISWLDEDAVSSQPAGTWIIPVDEDDWLDPNIADRIRAVDGVGTDNIITWDVIRKEADGTTARNPNFFIESCGYALRLPCNWGWVEDHMALGPADASEFRCRATHISEVIAVRNQTPASLGLLHQSAIKDHLHRLHQAIEATEQNIPERFQPVFTNYHEILRGLFLSIHKQIRD